MASPVRDLIEQAERDGMTEDIARQIADAMHPGDDDHAPVCVVCGWAWAGLNRCVNPECNRFCTWGPEKGADPSSWERHPDNQAPWPEGQWRPRPPPGA